MSVVSASKTHFTLYFVWYQSISIFRVGQNIFGKIPFLPDMNSEVHEQQKIANQVINPSHHSDINKFPSGRKTATKLLLCNLFQMCIKLMVLLFTYFWSQLYSKQKAKNVGLEWVGLVHCYHLALYISSWHLTLCRCTLKLSMLHVEIIYLVRNWNPIPSCGTDFYDLWVQSLVIWIHFTAVTFSQNVYGQTHSMSPSNSFKYPLSLQGNILGFVSLLKGLLCLSLPGLV